MNNLIYWTIKDGDKILIDDMSEQHVKNVLKMLILNKQKDPYCCFQKCLIEEEKCENKELEELRRFEKEFYEWDNYGSGGE